MLDSLSDSLRNLQFVDQKTLAAAFNLEQGFQTTESTSNVNVTTLPIPGLKQETVTNTGNVNAAGNPLPNTTQETTTKNRDTLTPQPPSLDTTPAFTSFKPNYGENASDLLSDQVNLSYQIFNLRMLLERSLSDRLEGDEPRLQAVLGFNVTIDPPRTSNDAVAVVEITLTQGPTNPADEEKGKQADPVSPFSLVALMPQEKTYNSAALSAKSHAFAGSAVAKIVQVGYSQRKRSQIFYLYRDNDTVSYERMVPDNPNKIVFGWMFRPVLGRRSVSPGLRQLFAIVALSAADRCTATTTASASDPKTLPNCPAEKLDASIRTFWKKYHPGTATSFEERDANRGARAGYGLSLGLSKPELFEARYTNANDYLGIEVRPTGGYQAQLKPQLARAFWMQVGAKSAVITAQGENFFTGTEVVIGDKTYSTAADGLILKSNEAFDLKITLDALASGPGAIIGRYGGAIPFVLPALGATADGVEIDQVVIGPSLSGSRSVEIYLRNRRADANGGRLPLRLADLPKNPDGVAVSPIVTLNGNTAALPYSLAGDVTTTGAPEPHVVLQATVPDAYVTTGTAIAKVFLPFFPDNWTATKHYYDPASAFELTRLSSKSIVVGTKDILGFDIDPRDTLHSKDVAGGTYCWKLLAADKPIALASSACKGTDPKLTTAISPHAIAVTTEEAIPDKIVLVSPLGAAWALDVPKSTSTSSTEPKAIALSQNDSSWVDVSVDDVTKVASVEANQQKLNFRPGKAAKPGDKVKTIAVEITRDLTAKPGLVELSVLDKDGKVLTTIKVQISCVDCKNTNTGAK